MLLPFLLEEDLPKQPWASYVTIAHIINDYQWQITSKHNSTTWCIEVCRLDFGWSVTKVVVYLHIPSITRTTEPGDYNSQPRVCHAEEEPDWPCRMYTLTNASWRHEKTTVASRSAFLATKHTLPNYGVAESANDMQQAQAARRGIRLLLHGVIMGNALHECIMCCSKTYIVLWNLESDRPEEPWSQQADARSPGKLPPEEAQEKSAGPGLCTWG